MRVVSATAPHQEPSADEPVSAARRLTGTGPAPWPWLAGGPPCSRWCPAAPWPRQPAPRRAAARPAGRSSRRWRTSSPWSARSACAAWRSRGRRATLPFVPICAGDLIAVGPASRAAVYLLDADTPLRLDEDTVGRFAAPPEPGSGIVELARGAVYFLSQVRRTLTIRTPYVNAGVEGTEVYLRVRDPAARPACPRRS